MLRLTVGRSMTSAGVGVSDVRFSDDTACDLAIRCILTAAPPDAAQRRPDRAPAADPPSAGPELGWRAPATVDDMCVDTWSWQSQTPQGYPQG